MRPLTAFDSLSWAGEGSKGRGSPLASQGRLAQLEERLVCNQKAGGSNPPASTLPLFVGDVSALPRASLRTVQPVGSSVHHPFLASQSTGFIVQIYDAAAFEPLWVWTHKGVGNNTM